GLERRLRSDELSPALEGHVAKYRKLVPALALIDHLVEGGAGDVGKESLLRALAMAEYLETHARRVYGRRTRSTSSPRRRSLPTSAGATLRTALRPATFSVTGGPG